MNVQIIQPSLPPPRPIRVAAYCRVSTEKDTQEASFSTQCTHYASYIHSRRDWVLAGIYAERGVSGTGKASRPQFNRLIADCESGLVDFVITKSISRFARNTADLLVHVRRLKALGIPVLFEKENLDTGTEESEFILGILAALAAEESRSISTNIKWGIRRRFEAGTYRHARAPYGYRKTDAGLAVFEPEAAVVREIYASYLSGDGAWIIAKRLNQRQVPTSQGAARWDPRTVGSLVRNPVYVGDLLYQKTLRDDHLRQRINRGQQDMFLNSGAQTPLIGREAFTLTGNLISMRGTASGKSSVWSTGKILCGLCGGPMHRHTRCGSSVHFFRCHTHRMDRTACAMGNIPEEPVQAAFLTMMNKLHYSESLQRKYRVLAAYQPATRQEQEAFTALRSAVRRWRLTDSLADFPALFFHNLIRHIIIHPDRIRFTWTCGLTLEEVKP